MLGRDMLRAAARIVVSLWLLAGTGTTAAEPARLALLIGNQSYAAKVGPLKNPRHDVALIESSLTRLGFTVTVLNDADYRTMDIALKRYVRELRGAGSGAIGFFYYSGHGAAHAETQINYLIPVDVANADDNSVWDQSFQQNRIIDLLSKQAKEATQFVVFDACRNELNLPAGAAKAIGADKGFVPVANTAGLLIAYATAPGRTASDLGDGGGPYAKALAEELLRPGVEAVEMFRHVQIRVKRAIGQDPWLSFPSLDPVYLAGREPPEPATPHAATSEAPLAWGEIKDSKDIVDFEAFRRQYGASNPFYDGLAAKRVEALKRAQVAIHVPPNAVNAPNPPPAPPRVDPHEKLLHWELPCDGVPIPVGQLGEERCIKPGSAVKFKDCTNCPEMVVVPSGSFMMGSPKREPESSDSEVPQHKVTIAKPFAVGRFAVTFAEWDAYIADAGWFGAARYKPSDEGWGRDDRPVINVNWEDAKSYVKWLSNKTGKEYRLLSEAEREYVTRAGTKTPFWWGSSITPEQANYNGSEDPYKGGGKKGECRHKTLPVESFKPNAWGLYQVHGNVWECNEDCWSENYHNAPSDGSALTTGDCSSRVLRGGSWGGDPRYLRAAQRDQGLSEFRNGGFGFRVARTLTP